MEEIKPTNPPSVTVADLDALGKEIVSLKDKIERMEADLTAENKALAKLHEKAQHYLKELGRDNYKTPFGTIYRAEKWQYKLPQTDSDWDNFFDWLRERGIYDQYVTVNAASMSSLCEAERKALEQQGEFFNVPGIEAPKLFETCRFVRSK